MAASVDNIKQLREQTSCGVIECKKALEEAKGDFDKAKKILQKRGLELAAKKGSRTAKEGRVESYIHLGSKIGVLVEVNCETDFVAKGDEFQTLCKNVAMHIAACSPKYIKKEDVPEDVLSGEKNPEEFVKASCLLLQPYVKDPSKSVQDCLNELIGKIGENMLISKFSRFQVGQID